MTTARDDLQSDNHRRLEIPVVPVPKQKPEDRVHNWDEAYLGYGLEAAMVEAERCIHCPSAPCQEACPTDNDIPGALMYLEKGDTDSAASIFRQTSNLPDMCGRLCPQESLCEGACVVGFAIRPAPWGKQPPVPGGVLLYGIPNFKMSKEILEAKIEYLTKMGVEFRCNVKVGEDITLEDLLQQYHATFLGTE